MSCVCRAKTEVFCICTSSAFAAGITVMANHYDQLLQLAGRFAHDWGHEYVGTEHLLLAVLNEETGAAAGLCRRFGVAPDAIRSELSRVLAIGFEPLQEREIILTPKARQAVEFAQEEARRSGHVKVKPEHLLLGLLRQQSGVAAQVLLHRGMDPDSVREALVPGRTSRST